MCVCLFLCNCLDVLVGVGHTLVSLAGFWRIPLTLLKRFTSAGHLTTSAWQQNKCCFRHFLLQGVNSASNFWQQEEGWFIYRARRGEKSVFILLSKELSSVRGRRDKGREMRIEKEKVKLRES